MYRVTKLDEDDWKKLICLMNYLNSTKSLVPTLKVNDLSVLKWHMDASHAVHYDCKGHTGGTLILGEGAVYATSTKQKLNTRSSTKTELVAANNLMPQILWNTFALFSSNFGALSFILNKCSTAGVLTFC